MNIKEQSDLRNSVCDELNNSSSTTSTTTATFMSIDWLNLQHV